MGQYRQIIFPFLCLLIVIGCNTVSNHKPCLDGWWVSTSMFDTIESNKSIYSNVDFLYHDLLFFKMDDDSIKTYGSIIDQAVYPIDCQKDTMGRVEGMDFAELIQSGQSITAESKYRIFKTKEKNSLNDTIPYVIETRKEVFRKSSKVEQEFIEHALTHDLRTHRIYEQWFAKKILSGNYRDLETNQLIELKENENCVGYKSFDKYKTHIMHGTMDSRRNDWIEFRNSQSDEKEILHYQFQDSLLFLYEYLIHFPEEEAKVGELRSKWQLVR